MFLAEDPRVFAERIRFAVRRRDDAEALILYQLTVDRMPLCSRTAPIEPQSLQRMKKLSFSAPETRPDM